MSSILFSTARLDNAFKGGCSCAEQEEANAGGADTRGQAIQTAYPEQPRTPATSMADASAQRPSEWAPEAGVGTRATWWLSRLSLQSLKQPRKGSGHQYQGASLYGPILLQSSR